MKRYKRIVFILGLVMVFSVGSNVFAFDNETSRERIRGVTGIHVVLSVQPFFLEYEGLSKSKIRTDVESELRLAGIKVLTKQELKKEKGQPIFYIYINGMKGPENILIYEVGVRLMQDASLVRKPNLTFLAPTWEVGTVGFGEIKNIQTDTKDKVDQFINAYLSVNPKT
jgi:hypothetical protein